VTGGKRKKGGRRGKRGGYPGECAEAIFECSRVWVFRGETVVDGDEDRGCGHGDCAAEIFGGDVR
jgi:hypothetical protein